jgi:hypothetical protein
LIADRAADAPTRIRPRPWTIRLALVALALLGASQLWTIFERSPWVWHDFTQDHVAIQEALAGRNPYEPQNDRIAALFDMPRPKGAAYSFHPPTTLVFFLPLAPLPYAAAFVVWDLVNLASLWAIVHLTARAVGRPLGPLASGAVALGLVAVWPLRENFVEGQLNIPVAAGLVAYWYCLRSDRPGLAGVALAAAVALKPLAGLFVLYALRRRQWRLLVWAAVALAAFGLVGSALAGIDGVRDYVAVAYPTHAVLWPGYPDNASPQGFFTRLYGPNPWRRPPFPTPGLATALTLASWALVVGLLFFRLSRDRTSGRRLDLEFAALGATMLLVTPIIWPHYYVMLVAPLAVLTVHLWERRSWLALAILGLAVAVLWVPRNEFVPRGMGNVQLPALLAVYAVALTQLGRGDRPDESPTRLAGAAGRSPVPA